MSDLPLQPPTLSIETQPSLDGTKLVRRRITINSAHDVKELKRRRSGTIVMAAIAIALLVHRRLGYDNLVFIAIESAVSLGFILLAGFAARQTLLKRSTKPPVHLADKVRLIAMPDAVCALCLLAAIATPWILNPISKQFGTGNGMEIVMLVSLGWGSLAFALLSNQLRTLSLSVVCSGFLTLFASFISDSSVALWFSLAWGILCLWWLINNHWAQVETAAAIDVRTSRVQHIVFTLLGCVIFLAAAYAVADRIPVLRKLQAELLPTSGGSSGKDAAARRGVGNGDALIAARKHATSFGAVDTDLFLDSEKPSLFDVFSNEFGEPKRRLQRVERAQALLPQDVQSEGGKFTEANRSTGASEFSIERELPEERKPVDDLAAESLMFWHGESGVHLAAQRFEHFDGVVWSNKDTSTDQPGTKIESHVVNQQHWFGPSVDWVRTSYSPFIGAQPEALKFTRYRSAIIPTRPGLQLWSIDEIDRADFFALGSDGCLYMPDREHVPDYTVVRMINSRIDLERLERLIENCSPGNSHQQLTQECQLEINHLAHEFVGDLPRGWKQVQAVVSGLRKGFELDRAREFTSSSIPKSPDRVETQALEEFLKDRRGPDYLFATAAAMMLDHLGYRTRLVVGFYANPKHYVAREGEISILPRDAHVWLEINVGHGYWIPLEPSPGYRLPAYSASLWYKIKENRWAIFLGASLVVATVLLVYWLRRWLIEWFSWLVLPVTLLFSHRLRVVWLTRLVEARCRLAGIPRSKGKVLRAHLSPLRTFLPHDLGQQVSRYLESADRLWFGGRDQLSEHDQAAIIGVWRGLTTQILKRSQQQLAAQQEFSEPAP